MIKKKFQTFNNRNLIEKIIIYIKILIIEFFSRAKLS